MRSGQQVGKYVLRGPIARGGMAEVWAAEVSGPEGFVKPVALKFILESFAGDQELERLFVNEARIAAQLQHANIVAVFDFGKVDTAGGTARGSAGTPGGSKEVGRYYIAMEKVDGSDLRRLLQAASHKNRRLPVGLALYIAAEVLKGLRYVHERRDPITRKPLGLVHRDVSPHNVLIGDAGEVKLSDFGIAKAMTQSLGTQAGMIRGKLAYASPEQIRAEPVDHRSDQFGLGITLWEMLSNARLFDGRDEMEIIGRVLRCEIPPMPVQAAVAPEVEAFVRRMLAARPEDRFPSSAEALSALVALPLYLADGRALSELMAELFPPDAVPAEGTAPMRAPARQAIVRRDADTRTFLADEIERPVSGASAAAGERAFKEDARSAEPDAITGSAYVSESASQPEVSRFGRSPNGTAIVVLVALFVMAAGAGWWALRRATSADSAEPGTATADPAFAQPEGPSTTASEPVAEAPAVPAPVEPANANGNAKANAKANAEAPARAIDASAPSAEDRETHDARDAAEANTIDAEANGTAGSAGLLPPPVDQPTTTTESTLPFSAPQDGRTTRRRGAEARPWSRSAWPGEGYRDQRPQSEPTAAGSAPTSPVSPVTGTAPPPLAPVNDAPASRSAGRANGAPILE